MKRCCPNKPGSSAALTQQGTCSLSLACAPGKAGGCFPVEFSSLLLYMGIFLCPQWWKSCAAQRPRASPTGRGRPCSDAGRGHQLISAPVTAPGDGCPAWLLAQHHGAGVASRCSPVAGYLLLAGARLVPVAILPSSAGAVRAGSRFPCTGAMMWSQVGAEQWQSRAGKAAALIQRSTISISAQSAAAPRASKDKIK